MNEKMALMTEQFSPYQWWGPGDGRNRPDETFEETEVMWVYKETSPGLWQVGFFSPSGQWYPESNHKDKDSAAERVRWLHGGN
jgi:hypothetical protein